MGKKKLSKKNLTKTNGGMPKTHVVVQTTSVSTCTCRGEAKYLLRAEEAKKTRLDLEVGRDVIDTVCGAESVDCLKLTKKK